MSEPSQTLFQEAPGAPKPKAPGPVEQVVGIFTDPVGLFRRLHLAPSWGWALGIVIGASLLLTVVWALKVDPEEMLRPILERNPQIQAAQIDAIIDMQKKFLVPMSVVGTLFGTPAALALVALFYWLIGKALPEGPQPSFDQAFSAVTVTALVKLPHILLILLICLLRPIGGLTPEKLAPTSLGYFLHPEGLKLQAFFYSLDLFALAESVLAFLALRNLMRMKAAGATLCVLLPLVAGIGLRLLGAK